MEEFYEVFNAFRNPLFDAHLSDIEFKPSEILEDYASIHSMAISDTASFRSELLQQVLRESDFNKKCVLAREFAYANYKSPYRDDKELVAVIDSILRSNKYSPLLSELWLMWLTTLQKNILSGPSNDSAMFNLFYNDMRNRIALIYIGYLKTHPHDSVCAAMNRRIQQSPILNISTYPDEPIYVPDMMVALVALSDYARFNNGKYSSTVKDWICRAKSEWVDDKTGLLVSFLDDNRQMEAPIKGSYAALNCYYQTKIDADFAKEQYDNLKIHFRQSFPATSIREYHDRSCWLGMDIDAGPIILNLSPSGTAFAIGCATYFADTDFRNNLLRTAEIAGHTVKWNNKRHYLLGDIALVGEAITLAMRTNYRTNNI